MLSQKRQHSRSLLLTYGFAVLAVFLATLLRSLLDPLLQSQVPYGIFYVAVAAAAWYGGIGPALLTMVLSSLAARFFFVDPRYALAITDAADLFSWLLFLGVALATTLLSQSHMENAAEAREHLVRLQQEMRERERTQKLLAETERRFQMLSETVPAMIWMTGPAGQFTYLNRQWLEFSGRTLEQQETRGWSQIVHADDIARFMEVYTNSVKKLEEFQVDFRLCSGDGTYCWVMMHGVPHFAQNGTFEGYIGSAVEIDDRKQEELRNEFLLKLMSALSRALTPKEVADVIIGQGLLALGGYIGVVALTDDDGKFLKMVNRRGVPEELVDLFRLLPIEANAPICDAVRTGQPVWIETPEQFAARYPTWASEVLPLTKEEATACLPLKVGKDVIGAITISFPKPMHFSQDLQRFVMTTAFQCAQAMERARLYEAEAAARQQAEAANVLKLRFLGMVSHELRAPLHLIMGFADMLLADDIEWDQQRLKDTYSILHQESHKLYELVEQLLDASQLQAGTLRIKQQEYPLSGVVEMARPEMEKFAEQHELVIDVPDDLPIVLVDPTRIGQVIVNLVSNAAKYSPPGTKIAVKASQVPDGVQIDVSDEGEGIPPKHRASIFEAFSRIDREREQRIKGVGLGLAIVKGVIEAHGGQVWVQDRPSPGTTMAFTVPLAQTPIEAD